MKNQKISCLKTFLEMSDSSRPKAGCAKFMESSSNRLIPDYLVRETEGLKKA